jgi:hypothetical protein
MPTATDICNMALDMLREAPISSVDDGSLEADWFKRNYAQVRDASLIEHPWNFAIRRHSLPASASAPAFDWLHAYDLPTDCLRVLPLRAGGRYESAMIPHEVELSADGTHRQILTNAAAPLKIRAIMRVTNEDLFTATFVEVFASGMACKLAHWITGKQSMVQALQSIHDNAMRDAKRVDGQEGTLETPYADDVIAARYA